MGWKRAEKSSFCQLHLTEVVLACTIDGSCPKRERERAGAGGARTPAYRTRPPECGPPRRGRQGRARQELDHRRGVGVWPPEARSPRRFRLSREARARGGRAAAGGMGPERGRWTSGRDILDIRSLGQERKEEDAQERGDMEKKRKRKRKVHCNHFPIWVHVKLQSQTG